MRSQRFRAGFLRRRAPRCIEPGEWPERAGRARVLVENPDGAQRWAGAEIFRDAGYDVAVCSGPTSQFDRTSEPKLCPLLVDGRCSLVEQADVVVSTTSLPESRGILAALGRRRSPALVVEAGRAGLDPDREAAGEAKVIEFPATEQMLIAAVGEALASRS